MPRRPAALDPASPIATFASELRALRDRLGGDAPSVDEVSAATKIPRSTLYAALRGDRLPSRKVLTALVRAWGGDDARWLTKRSVVESLISSEAVLGAGNAFVAAGGDIHIQHMPHGLSWPVQVGTVPLLSSGYQIRDESAIIEQAGDSGVPLILQGLGGVGKSQLAAAYARSQTNKVDLLLWVNASSRPSIITAYAEASVRLGHSTPSANSPDAARRFLTWLQSTKRPWLVVLDDVSDPVDLQELWPDGPVGRTLVTTRRSDAALIAGRITVAVDVFRAEEAVAYLASMLNTFKDDPVMDEAESLAADLGFLPLAMGQAAAFMRDRGESCSGYRNRLANSRLSLVELFPSDAITDDYRATLSVTWSISVQAADQLAPRNLSSSLLQVLSLLSPYDIPVDVIRSRAVAGYLQSQRSQRGGDTVTSTDCQDALHNLARLSLVTLDNTNRSKCCRVHPLVQRSAIEKVDPANLQKLKRVVADAVVEVWSEAGRDADLEESLRVNTATLILHAGTTLWQPTIHSILWWAGYGMGKSGLIDDAVNHWNWMVQEATRRLGPDHPDALVARHNLASWRGQAGDPVGAAVAFEQLLTDRLRVLGPDHPDTLTTRNNLAFWRGQAGDPVGAAVAFEQLLTDRLRVLGPDHPDTLTTLHNLASLRGQAGEGLVWGPRLIAIALTAGVIATASGGTTAKLNDAYCSLKSAVVAGLRRRGLTDLSFSDYERAPERWESTLEAELKEVRMADDVQVMEAALRLLTVLDVEWRKEGYLYSIEVRASQGVQIGDGNTQTNTFSSSRGRSE